MQAIFYTSCHWRSTRAHAVGSLILQISQSYCGNSTDGVAYRSEKLSVDWDAMLLKGGGFPLIFLLLAVTTVSSHDPLASNPSTQYEIALDEESPDLMSLSVVNLAKTDPLPGIRFLWYYSDTVESPAWILWDTGTAISIDPRQFSKEGAFNLTVIYPNNERVSVVRPLHEEITLVADAFANGQLLNTGQRVIRMAMTEGSDFSFECVFQGYPTNVRIVLPDNVECPNQSHNATSKSIAVQCQGLQFKEGKYGCEGQNPKSSFRSEVYLYGRRGTSSRLGFTWLHVTLTLLTLAYLLPKWNPSGTKPRHPTLLWNLSTYAWKQPSNL